MRSRSGIFLVASVLMCSGCLTYQEVEVKQLTDFRIIQLRGDSISIEATVRVNNPNGYRIKLRKPNIHLLLNNDTIGEAFLPNKLTLEKELQQEYKIPVDAFLTRGSGPLVTAALGSVFGLQQMVRVRGTVRGKAGIISKQIPFEFEHPLELPSHFGR